MTRLLIFIAFLLFVSSCKELPSGKVEYIDCKYINETNLPINKKIKGYFNLTFASTFSLYAMKDSVGFATFFLRCPIDGDFNNYTKDSIFFLRDNCFACDNVIVDNVKNNYIYTVPVSFQIHVSQNAIPYDISELESVLNQLDSCLECRIYFTQLPGKTRMTNKFCIPIEKLKRYTE